MSLKLRQLASPWAKPIEVYAISILFSLPTAFLIGVTAEAARDPVTAILPNVLYITLFLTLVATHSSCHRSLQHPPQGIRSNRVPPRHNRPSLGDHQLCRGRLLLRPIRSCPDTLSTGSPHNLNHLTDHQLHEGKMKTETSEWTRPRQERGRHMIVTAKNRKRTLRLLTVTLILIGLTAALAACRQPVFTSISSGLTQACGLKQDGTPVCWSVGQNYYTPFPQDGEDKPPKGRKIHRHLRRIDIHMRSETRQHRTLLGRQPRGPSYNPRQYPVLTDQRRFLLYMCPYDRQGTPLLGQKFRRANGRSGRGEIQHNHHRGDARMRPQRGRVSRLLGIKHGRTNHAPAPAKDSPASAPEPTTPAQSTWRKPSTAGATTNGTKQRATGQPEFQPSAAAAHTPAH